MVDINKNVITYNRLLQHNINDTSYDYNFT